MKFFIEADGYKVYVKKLKERKLFGRDEVLIKPIAGGKERWVVSRKIRQE